MKDNLKNDLDVLFAAHDTKTEKAKKQKSERECQEEAFLQAFYEHQEKVIIPAFEDMGSYINKKGYKFKIDVQKESSEGQGKTNDARATIRFLVDSTTVGYVRDHEFPHFSVICNKSARNVCFHQSTISPGRGGTARSIGEAKLEDVTADFLHEKLVNLLSEVFK